MSYSNAAPSSATQITPVELGSEDSGNISSLENENTLSTYQSSQKTGPRNSASKDSPPQDPFQRKIRRLRDSGGIESRSATHPVPPSPLTRVEHIQSYSQKQLDNAKIPRRSSSWSQSLKLQKYGSCNSGVKKMRGRPESSQQRLSPLSACRNSADVNSTGMMVDAFQSLSAKLKEHGVEVETCGSESGHTVASSTSLYVEAGSSAKDSSSSRMSRAQSQEDFQSTRVTNVSDSKDCSLLERQDSMGNSEQQDNREVNISAPRHNKEIVDMQSNTDTYTLSSSPRESFNEVNRLRNVATADVPYQSDSLRSVEGSLERIRTCDDIPTVNRGTIRNSFPSLQLPHAEQFPRTPLIATEIRSSSPHWSTHFLPSEVNDTYENPCADINVISQPSCNSESQDAPSGSEYADGFEEQSLHGLPTANKYRENKNSDGFSVPHSSHDISNKAPLESFPQESEYKDYPCGQRTPQTLYSKGQKADSRTSNSSGVIAPSSNKVELLRGQRKGLGQDKNSVSQLKESFERVFSKASSICHPIYGHADRSLHKNGARSSTDATPFYIKVAGSDGISDEEHDDLNRSPQSEGSASFPKSADEYHRTLGWISNQLLSSARQSQQSNERSSEDGQSLLAKHNGVVKEANSAGWPFVQDVPTVSKADLQSSLRYHGADNCTTQTSEDRSSPYPSASGASPTYDFGSGEPLSKSDAQIARRDFAETGQRRTSTFRCRPNPMVRKISQAVSIEEHKPKEQREKFPEPFFVPQSVVDAELAREQSQGAAPLKNVPTRIAIPTTEKMRDTVRRNQRPDVQRRFSSSLFRSRSAQKSTTLSEEQPSPSGSYDRCDVNFGPYVVEFPGYAPGDAINGTPNAGPRSPSHYFEEVFERGHTVVPWLECAPASDGPGYPEGNDTIDQTGNERTPLRSESDEKVELLEFQKGLRRHHSFRGRLRASLRRTRPKDLLARDWSTSRKRFAATVACASTALLGLNVGIYAGQVPAIQYAIVDEGTHYAVLGNVLFYLGLALTTIVAWPLPLLYGRKRLVLTAMAIMLPLQFPQALVVSQQRDPRVPLYRIGLLLPRFISGVVAGFANINLWPVLLDVFGCSLRSRNPHQEHVDENDPRRHGGGMGVWLSIWIWCHIGSIGVGFFVGALVIGFLNVSWGFWIVIFATLGMLLLNIMTPETRKSEYRKAMAEVRRGPDISRRVGRGEVMMHLYATGSLHWWEELRAGMVLSARMLKQPGFAIMALYQGWIYGQVVMIMILLGALSSRYYSLVPQYVAVCVAAFPVGALLAIPFQKASIFSRSRHRAQRTDSMTFEKRISWSSHLVRRALFVIALPFAALAYTLSSGGPPATIALPVLFAAFIGFLTNLALSECYGLIMETFDTSDLQPGMTGRPRKELPPEALRQRTNFSSFPRVTAGFAIVQTLSFGIAAAATALGGNLERSHGVQAATAIVAAVLLGLSVLLIAVLTRYRTVQVVPTNRVGTAELSGPGEDLPVIIGHPSGTNRRISMLELGALTRWTEIRRRNKLLGSGRHGNRS